MEANQDLACSGQQRFLPGPQAHFGSCLPKGISNAPRPQVLNWTKGRDALRIKPPDFVGDRDDPGKLVAATGDGPSFNSTRQVYHTEFEMHKSATYRVKALVPLS